LNPQPWLNQADLNEEGRKSRSIQWMFAIMDMEQEGGWAVLL
jgi:hypothetical protein